MTIHNDTKFIFPRVWTLYIWRDYAINPFFINQNYTADIKENLHILICSNKEKANSNWTEFYNTVRNKIKPCI